MSLESIRFRLLASASDRKRDAAIPFPEGVSCRCDIPYAAGLLLDVYCPQGDGGPLPTIVSIHGGGYVYGSKEVYRRYGMDLARRGFAFVNFNYRLAPGAHFPAPLEDANAVLEWVCRNGEEYRLDPGCIFLVGDSAGAQLASQYAAIASNREYAALFSFRVPPVGIRALGLNCGMYDMAGRAAQPRKGLLLDYLGRELNADDPRFQVLEAVDGSYPPAFITTACCDFLRDAARPMYDWLTARGVPAQVRCYGTEGDRRVGHVFHVNIALPEAVRCNDEECAFFREYI